MFLKRVLYGISSILLSLSSLVVLMSPAAHAATKTWTGGGGSGDTNMSSATNWGGSAPVAGDDLVFPLPMANTTVVNDFPAATSFNSITFNGNAGSYAVYLISGASMTIVAGISNTSDNGPTISAPLIINSDQTLNLQASLILGGVVSGTGNLIKSGGGDLYLNGANTFSGNLTISSGGVYADANGGLGQATGSTIVSNGAQLNIISNTSQNATLAEPITLNGSTFTTGYGYTEGIFTSRIDSGSQNGDGTLTLTGAVTLGAAAQFSANGVGSIINISGALSGNYVASVYPGSQVQLNVNSNNNTSGTANGVYFAPVQETTYSENSPNVGILVGFNQTAIVTGNYGSANILNKGTLKGTGSVTSLGVSSGGTIAPGMSPGVLNTGNVTFSGGTYQTEIGGTGAGQYDQLNVTGTVSLGSGVAMLSSTQYNNFIPNMGDTFTIIKNDSNDAVTGSFLGLAEGATVISTNGVEYTISYKGGDGNDVVLTASKVPSTPSTPNTGAQLLKNNPIVTLVVTIIAAVGIALIAKRKFAVNKK